MGKITGFKDFERENFKRREVTERVNDWKEIYFPWTEKQANEQASRCIDCGVPFCNNGCPLGNLIPDWNDLVSKGDWKKAIEQLHATNNFPEFTGRICPAPCEHSCVLGINQDPVSIENIEKQVIEKAFIKGYVNPNTIINKLDKKVAVIGFDDLPMSKSFYPPLSTIYQPRFQIGEKSMELLFEKIKIKKNMIDNIKLKTKLIIRESTAKIKK